METIRRLNNYDTDAMIRVLELNEDRLYHWLVLGSATVVREDLDGAIEYVRALPEAIKAYLLAFIDDHSRLVPHAEFYLTESLPSYLKALEEALVRRGLPRKIYTDNGSAFRSHHLEHVTASLGIALIHERPYKPQGKGKIERFFRTVRGDFLSGFKGTTLAEFLALREIIVAVLYRRGGHVIWRHRNAGARR
jgi:transposase InsO family protein